MNLTEAAFVAAAVLFALATLAGDVIGSLL